MGVAHHAHVSKQTLHKDKSEACVEYGTCNHITTTNKTTVAHAHYWDLMRDAVVKDLMRDAVVKNDEMRDAIVKNDEMRDAIVKDLMRDAVVKNDNMRDAVVKD